MAKLVPDELVRGREGVRNSEQLSNKAKNEQTKEVGMSHLPIDDLNDALMLAAEFTNDISNKVSLAGYLDNLPLMYAAWEGKENIIPQANDVDPIEKEVLKANIAEKLQISVGAENVVDKGVDALYALNEFRKAIVEAQEETIGQDST